MELSELLEFMAAMTKQVAANLYWASVEAIETVLRLLSDLLESVLTALRELLAAVRGLIADLAVVSAMADDDDCLFADTE